MRQLRRAQDITQEELADITGLHRAYVGQVETGQRNPTYANLLRIAQGLSTPLSEWIALAEQPPPKRRRRRGTAKEEETTAAD